MNHQPTMLMISGSLRGGSTNTAVLRTAQAIAPDEVLVTMYEGMSELPHFNPDDDCSPLAATVETLRAMIRASDAIVSTPEYAGELPGSFKNVLDWAVGDDQAGSMSRKPVAWINCSQRGAIDAYAALRRVLGFLGATIVEDACIEIPVAKGAVGPDGLIASETVREPLAEALAHLVRAASEER